MAYYTATAVHEEERSEFRMEHGLCGCGEIRGSGKVAAAVRSRQRRDSRQRKFEIDDTLMETE